MPTTPDLPTCRAALADATQICGNAVQWLDLPATRQTTPISAEWVAAELRADIQAARAQLDRAERALTSSEGV